MFAVPNHVSTSVVQAAVRPKLCQIKLGKMRNAFTAIFQGLIVLCGFLLISAVTTTTLYAQNDTRWKNPISGDFESAINWDNGIPGVPDTAIFDLDATYGVVVNANTVIGSLDQRDGNVTISGGNILTAVSDSAIQSGTLTFTGISSNFSSGFDFRIGAGLNGQGTLNIAGTNIDFANKNGFLGSSIQSTGTANITGAESKWTNRNLFLGTSDGTSDSGQGFLQIGDTSRVIVGDSSFDANTYGLIVGDSGTNGNLFIRNGSTINAQRVTLALDSGSTASMKVNGANSQVNIAGVFNIAGNGDATVDITDGGRVTSELMRIGLESSATGTVTVSGTDSQLNSGGVFVGRFGTGTISIQNGGQVHSNQVNVGSGTNGNGNVLINGNNSLLETVGDLSVGEFGNGVLTIENGGRASVVGEARIGGNVSLGGMVSVSGIGSELSLTESLFIKSSGSLFVGPDGEVSNANGSVDGISSSATVTGKAARWDNLGTLTIGSNSSGDLIVADGGVVTSTDTVIGGTGSVTVCGLGSRLDSLTLDIDNNGAAGIRIENGGLVTSGSAIIGSSLSLVPTTGRASLSGVDSVWAVDQGLVVANTTFGTLNVFQGLVTSRSGIVGEIASSRGSVHVSVGGRWENLEDLNVGVGGQGDLLISDNGYVSNTVSALGLDSTGVGTANITDSGSHWESFGDLSIGVAGTGGLTIENGGRVSSNNSLVGTNSTGTGNISVTGSGSRWESTGNLTFGSSTVSNLSINNSGLVSVGGTTSINQFSNVNLSGGRFEFGTTDLGSLSRVGGSSGSLAGVIEINGYNHIESLNIPSVANLDTSEILASNTGVIYGSGQATVGFLNSATGEIRTVSGESARFSGMGSTNAGEINNFGGLIEFQHGLTNLSGGFIGGRGQFINGGGLTNEGVIAFTAGEADILGDVVNAGGGQIVTSGSGILTFFDDVVHNGAEIRTADGSQTVFLGEFSGAGSFTGVGDVFFEGDLRPGNSPDVVDFEGDVFIGSGVETYIELAGLQLGEYDRFNIIGDLSLGGDLMVDLIDGFSLTGDQQFLIADVGGSLLGQFDGLNEGDLVGNYGGRDLFISYSAGNGNGVSLFTTAVPEPGSAAVLVLLGMGFTLRRRRSLRTAANV